MDISANIGTIKTTLEQKFKPPFINDTTRIQMIHRDPTCIEVNILKNTNDYRTVKFCCSLKKSRNSGVMCDYYSSNSIWVDPQTFNITNDKKWKSILEDLFPESKTTKKKQQTTQGGGATATQGGGGGNKMQQQQQQQKKQQKKQITSKPSR